MRTRDDWPLGIEPPFPWLPLLVGVVLVVMLAGAAWQR